MSVNRENVTWQRADGTWAIGFWDYYSVNTDSPDFDYEWDVAYSDQFREVHFGKTPDEAYASYTRFNANPGGTHMAENTPENADYIAALEAKLAKYREREQAHNNRMRTWG